MERDYIQWRKAALRIRGGNCSKITIITRKAYGGAYDVMSSKHLGGDLIMLGEMQRLL